MKFSQKALLILTLVCTSTLFSTNVFATQTPKVVTSTFVASNLNEELINSYTAAANNAIKTYFDASFKDSNCTPHIDVTSEESIQAFLNAEFAEADKEAKASNDLKGIEAWKKTLETYASGRRKVISTLGHDLVKVEYIANDDSYDYFCQFNKSTKELISLEFFDLNALKVNALKSKNQSKVTSISSAELKSAQTLASDFIKKHKLGNIENPTFINHKVKGNATLLYQDANDKSKEVIVLVNPTSNKVIGFSISTYAHMEAGKF